ncbi:hypothetical protein BGZ79_009228 [Entomortierella chlamydospora]|nr:hypothetical protein BGZ79_009228 [Entomortierella chlamydospora]
MFEYLREMKLQVENQQVENEDFSETDFPSSTPPREEKELGEYAFSSPTRPRTPIGSRQDL